MSRINGVAKVAARKKSSAVPQTFTAKKGARKAKSAPRSETPSAAALVSIGVVAQWLNLTERRVQQLADEGVVIREGRGRYDLRASVTAYIGWLQLRTAPSAGGDMPAGELDQARLRRTQAQAELLELRASEQRSELVPASAVAAEWGDILRMLRAGVLAIPTRMGAKLPHLTTHDLDELDKELRRVLTDLGHDPVPVVATSPSAGASGPGSAAAPGAVDVD